MMKRGDNPMSCQSSLLFLSDPIMGYKKGINKVASQPWFWIDPALVTVKIPWRPTLPEVGEAQALDGHHVSSHTGELLV